MNFLSTLYNLYNSAEKAGLVDKQDGNKTVLLPLYHTSLKSSGNNIIKVILDEDGKFYKAEILDKENQIIFPVTEDSVSRSGKKPAAHPLSDKLSYFLGEEPEKNDSYKVQFVSFIDALDKESECYRFMKMIQDFIRLETMFSLIVSSIYEGKDYHIEGSKVNLFSGKKKSVINLGDYFLTFEVLNFKNNRNYNVTNYISLHRAYIRYIENREEVMGTCCISGERQSLTTKHRGVIQNAKIVSVSNNKETYYGRFKEKSDIISVGYKTSEKAHLMLKFLLDNNNSCRWIADQQYLVNWFSDDIENMQNFDIEKRATRVNRNMKSISFNPVTTDNKEVGNAFRYGWNNFDHDSRYYLAIVDQSSKGRVSIKYFREMHTSELVRKIKKWHEQYHWYYLNKNNNELEERTASFDQIINATYGIERDGVLTLPDEKFKKNLHLKMISYLVDGAHLPKSISKQLAVNLRQRSRYKKTWNELVDIALGILNYERSGEYNTMLDKKNHNRSYLYGRLLAVYDLMEQSTFNEKEIKMGSERVTNAQSYWAAYNRSPATTMKLLEIKIKPYEKKLHLSRPGLYYKLQKEKSEIINMLHDVAYFEKVADRALEYDFIFGYQAEVNFIFIKQEEEK